MPYAIRGNKVIRKDTGQVIGRSEKPKKYIRVSGNPLERRNKMSEHSDHKEIRMAMKHKDVLGAGAKKRRKLRSKKDKVHAVMKEYERGTLYSGSGKKVKSREQAIAIAMSEAGMTRGM